MISKKFFKFVNSEDENFFEHLCVSVDFDIDGFGIVSECPDCLYKKLGKRKYYILMELLVIMYSKLSEYYDIKELEYGKQKKSKKKSRHKDIQKSC